MRTSVWTLSVRTHKLGYLGSFKLFKCLGMLSLLSIHCSCDRLGCLLCSSAAQLCHQGLQLGHCILGLGLACQKLLL